MIADRKLATTWQQFSGCGSLPAKWQQEAAAKTRAHAQLPVVQFLSLLHMISSFHYSIYQGTAT
jgi:hypothetical protein